MKRIEKVDVENYMLDTRWGTEMPMQQLVLYTFGNLASELGDGEVRRYTEIDVNPYVLMERSGVVHAWWCCQSKEAKRFFMQMSIVMGNIGSGYTMALVRKGQSLAACFLRKGGGHEEITAISMRFRTRKEMKRLRSHFWEVERPEPESLKSKV